MTRFYLVRHAEPMYEMIAERNLGKAQRDFVPLTSTGISQAEMVASDSRIQNVELIVSSPYTRSLQTASIISRSLDVPIQVEFDLYEWTPDLNGEFHTYEELIQITNDFLACKGAYPDGEYRIWETKDSVVNRTESVLERYRRHQEVIVVCHGMVISCLTDTHHENVPYCGIFEVIR